jgi:dipeptidyl aminopeptidase/acylaminoacyl peptidase
MRRRARAFQAGWMYNRGMRILLVLSFVASGATIEQYLSAPFPSEMHAAPGGGRVVWLLNERGARNLWVASAPDYKGRRLTAYKEDDGQDVGMIQWTADGRSIVYVRGGNLEQIGQAGPNPLSLAQMPDQSIWIIPFEGGAPKKLAEGHSPAVSKSGRIAFIRASQIWMTNAEGEKPVEAVHTRGASSNLRWSPDGSELAFTNSRGDHSFIGVYKPGDNSVTYLDPSTDRDRSPAWSLDGRRVAFIRTPSVTVPGDFEPHRQGLTPWSIRVADVSTGAGREAWHADRGPGSVYHAISATDQLYWTDGDRLAFAWEKTGWNHLYSVSAEGGRATELTPGEFEIEDAALSENRRDMLFSSNQDDIDRRHIWRVAASGGKATPVLGKIGEGIEWEPEDAGNGAIVYFRSSAKEMGRAVVKPANAAPRDLAPETIPPDYPMEEQVIPQQVIIKAADGMMIHSQLFMPKTSGKHPAILFLHGGPRRQMLLGWHNMDAYAYMYGVNEYWANKGYVVLSVNYRSGTAYGLNFREAINFGPTGASEFNDVMGAGLYLASRADVDPKRIAVWGGSYGGYLTAMALARASDLFAAGVDLMGVHDWSALVASVPTPPLDSAKQNDQVRLAFESSPMASIKTWKSPVLLVHGDDDRNVAFSETVHLVEALRAQGVEFEELVFPDEVHDYLLFHHWITASKAADQFFDRKLKP